MKLVIAEKPSVGAAIAAVMGANEKRSGYFEGGGYLLSWCIGHLISLADAATYNEQSVNGSTTIFHCPAGVAVYCCQRQGAAVFHSQRPYAPQRRYRDYQCLRQRARGGTSFSALSMNRRIAKSPFPAFGLAAWKQVQSARAFQISKTGAAMTTSINPRFAEQRPIGSLALTRPRLFSILYHKTLNVGRVQTPTLAMLVNRDYAISSFKKEKYHVVRLDVGGVAALSERQDDEAAARQMKAACEKSQAVCTSLKKEKKTAAPPKLFDPHRLAAGSKPFVWVYGETDP